MKNLLLSSVAAAAITLAVDGPARAASPYNWTGCYIGGNAGGAWANKDFSPDFNPLVGGPVHMSGFAGGVQTGCDYQSGTLVVGARGMFDWTDMHGDAPFAQTSFGGGKGYRTNISWFATATGRLGYLPQPNLLFFVTGGAAFVRDKFQFIVFGPPFGVANVTRSGRLVGGGVEWMFAPFWSVSIEYDYMNFGSKNINFQGVGGFGDFSDPVYQNVQTVLVGLNYRFGSGGGR
jgi:outer membrane immunogenic protein